MPGPSSAHGVAGDALVSRTTLRQAIRAAIAEAGEHGRNCAVLVIGVEPKDRLQLLTQDWPDGRIAAALERLPASLRKADRYASLGQRQCCVLLPGLANVAQALLAAHKISRDLSEALAERSGEAWTRVLIGIACHPQHANDADALLMRADAALAQADASEDGIFVFPHDASAQNAPQLPVSRAEMLEALGANDYRLVYQPQVDLASGRCRSAEALLRCTTRSGTRIPPDVLARVAEQEGRVAALTANILNTALRQMAEWSSDGVDLQVSVNLSPSLLSKTAYDDGPSEGVGCW